jgi:hypothetical protein
MQHGLGEGTMTAIGRPADPRSMSRCRLASIPADASPRQAREGMRMPKKKTRMAKACKAKVDAIHREVTAEERVATEAAIRGALRQSKATHDAPNRKAVAAWLRTLRHSKHGRGFLLEYRALKGDLRKRPTRGLTWHTDVVALCTKWRVPLPPRPASKTPAPHDANPYGVNREGLAQTVTDSPSTARKVSHSEDFTTVSWFGTRYTFDDGLQAKAIACLWTEYEKGEHGLSEKGIGESIGSNASNYRLSSTFRGHPSWGTMIVKVRQGIYCLKTPE